jgi:putative nucleotidyltransferase with HDIG domain
VLPVSRSIAAGETIIRRGEVVQAEDIEALQEVGLLTTFSGWQTQVGTLAVVLLSAVLIILFFLSYPRLINNTKQMITLLVLFLLFLGITRFVSPGHLVIPYLYPMAAYSLLVAALIDRRTALYTTIPLAIMAAYGMPNSIDLTLYYSLGGLMGLLVLRRPQRLSAYVSVAGIIAITGSVILVAYRIIDPATDATGLATLIAASVFNGVASAGLTVLLEYVLAPLLDLTTTLQLVELSRPDHPLLQRLLREIPGTYQHTLQVANLVEQAAERIQANSMLARVGALYHDIGKMKNPQFFIENQGSNQINTHDDMDPEESARIIIDHVVYGLELAKKYRLPRRIREFIPEHHGTLITRYQYGKALELAGGDESKVDPSKFRYPGPRPQSRETALVMLGDGCEAYVRSQNPETDQELRNLIKEMVDRRVALGQLDNTPLTLKDLNMIIDSFTATLKGTYHARMDYPESEMSAENEQDTGLDDDTLIEEKG